MKSFLSLYNKIVDASVNNKLDDEIGELKKASEYDKHQLDCLLNPETQPAVIRVSDCSCTDGEKESCVKACSFDAITRDENRNLTISKENCVGCADCIENCKQNNLTDRKEIVPIFELLNSCNVPVYAMIAPAYVSQFSEEITPGKLRGAFKKLGFTGMIEVALFADILTLKEALEFDNIIQNVDDFMLTSCCCPIWIAMIKKIYNELVPHLPPSVSPMAACGRSIKILYPEAKTVFIGPCIAKKAESKDKDIIEAVDYVLTFQEMKDIFDAAELDPAKQDEDSREHSSRAGRIYARTAGVSEAVQNTLQRLKPQRTIPIKAFQADGAAACKALLKEIKNGNIQANFLEGMGCIGGCVGGPKALIKKEDALHSVNEYGDSAVYKTPADNPYVMELLERLGFDTIESLIYGDNIFTRDFKSIT